MNKVAAASRLAGILKSATQQILVVGRAAIPLIVTCHRTAARQAAAP
jgi:hypothetical protein